MMQTQTLSLKLHLKKSSFRDYLIIIEKKTFSNSSLLNTMIESLEFWVVW